MHFFPLKTSKGPSSSGCEDSKILSSQWILLEWQPSTPVSSGAFVKPAHTSHSHALGTSPVKQKSNFFIRGLGCTTAFSAGHCWTQACSCTLSCFGSDHMQFLVSSKYSAVLAAITTNVPSVFCPTGSRAFCYFYPVVLPAPISCHLWTQAPAFLL